MLEADDAPESPRRMKRFGFRNDHTRYVNERHLRQLEAQCSALQAELHGIRQSRAWQLTQRLRAGLVLCRRLGAKLSILIAKRSPNRPPTVTVVLVARGKGNGLQESLESLLSQSLSRLEILVVIQDLSTETETFLARYQNHATVRILVQPSGEAPGNAFNRALREARGDYLAIQTPWGTSHPRRLERSLRALSRHQADGVYCGPAAPDLPPLGTMMLRCSSLKQAGGFEPNVAEDAGVWLRLQTAGFKTIRLDEPLVTLTPASTAIPASSCQPVWRPRVVYLIPGVGISGGTAVICQHANRLKQRGFEVLLLDVMESDRPITWFPGLEVDVVPFSRQPANIDVAIATGWQTVSFLEQMDVGRGLYFVQSDESRFFDDPGMQAHIRATYTRPFEYMTEARWIQRWLEEEFGHHATYVPNGLDPAIIHPATPIEPKGDRLRVLLEGPIDIPFKGMADAFSAVKGLDCEVWCVSSHGVPRPHWRCDRFFHAIPMQEMKHIYSSCDILLKMSRVEGFFGPPLEMMACGGVSVVAKVTGYDEYITEDVNALVVEAGDVLGARDAVRRLLEEPSLRARLIEAGHRTAEKWRWEPTIDRLEQLLMSPRPTLHLSRDRHAPTPLH